MNFINILIATIADAAPMLIGVLAVYFTGRAFVYVATAPSKEHYSVSIGGHRNRLSALE